MKEKDTDRCDTCGAKLDDGYLPGNHVRGDKDQFCDICCGDKPEQTNGKKAVASIVSQGRPK